MQTSRSTETKTKLPVESKCPQSAYDWLDVIRSHIGSDAGKKPEGPRDGPSSPLSDFVVLEPSVPSAPQPKPTRFTDLAQAVASHMAERAGRYRAGGCGGVEHLVNLTGK